MASPSTVPIIPSLNRVQTPPSLRRLSLVLLAVFAALPFVLALTPWQQSVHGTGVALAFNPVERPQTVLAPIQGRVMQWFVVEGKPVKQGQKLVELADNDRERLERLKEQGQIFQLRIRAAVDRIEQIQTAIDGINQNLIQARLIQDQTIANATNEKIRAEQGRVATQAAMLQTRQAHERMTKLVQAGTNPRQSLEETQRNLDQAIASDTAQSKLIEITDNQIDIARKRKVQIEKEFEILIARENALLNSATAEKETVRSQEIDNRTAIERQSQQVVRAPCDGTIYQIVANGEAGGQLVNMGQQLAVIVPDIKEKRTPTSTEVDGLTAVAGSAPGSSAIRLTTGEDPGIVAALLVDGNDLPLIHKGDRVRLQFEGWPAVQFVGWPSVARGTFPGKVFLVDPTATDRQGMFRILVEPDPGAEGVKWPGPEYLRQGVRCQGWVLLENVSAGYEIWRQLNGFPPTRTPPKDKGNPQGPVSRK
jgi:multidrug efflux pump subunit AcrA (membrane-fusion protein)